MSRSSGITARLKLLLLTSAALVPLFTTQVLAQDAASTAAEVNNVEDIVVTARKRNERLIDVPVAITALDSEALERYATSDLSSVGTQIPQVMFTKNPSGNGANITIRGVGSNTSADDGIEQAVSVNIDGVPTARGRVLQSGLFDIANVQVLKGPQVLYFGKNSPGGVIVVESQGPTDSFQGYVRGGYEFQAHESFGELAVGGPITDTLRYRLALRASDMQQGYVRNIAQPIAAADNPVAWDRMNGYSIPGRAFEWGPNAETWAGRLTLDWRPNDAFDATFKLLVSDYKDEGDASQNVLASCAVGQTNATTTDLSNALFTGIPGVARDPYGVCGDRRVNTIGELPAQLLAGLPFNKGDSEFTENRNYLSSLVMNYRLDNVTLTSVTGYYKYTNDGTSFFDSNTLSLAGGGANSHSEAWNQEIRAATTFDGPFNVTVGAFYSNEERTYRTFSSIIRYLSPTGNSVTSTGISATDGDTLSAFFEATWNITPELELAAGARYTKDSKDGTLQNDYVSGPGAAFNVALPVGVVIPARLRNSNTSPQVTLSWHPTPNSTLYAGYRTGFKAGAITNPGLIAPNVNSQNVLINPEEVDGYEAGFKFVTDDRRLSGDIAMYHYEYTDLQVSAFDSVSNTVRTQNAGGSEVDGVEASVNYRLTDAFSVHAAGGYNRGRYSTFTNAACWGGQTVAQGCVAAQQNLTGQPLPRAPEWSGSAGANWEREISGNLLLGASFDVRYTSEYNFVATNNPYAIQDDYVAMDAALRVTNLNSGWEVALIGKNLADEFYYTVGSERPLGRSPGSIQGVPGLPRTVQLQATYNF